MMKKIEFFAILILFSCASSQAQRYYPPWIPVFTSSHGVPWYTQYFCKNNTDLVLAYIANNPSIYYVWINNILNAGTVIEVKFDAQPTLFINNEHFLKNNSKFIKDPDTVNNIYTFEFVNNTEELQEIFRVEGNTPYHTTHVTSLKINGDEKCKEPNLEIFEADNRYERLSAPDKFCGRRKVSTNIEENSLAFDSPGFWPWLAAIEEIQDGKSYHLCSGTLISPDTILTVASCVVVGNATFNPELLEVILGKHFSTQNDTVVQKIKVSNVIFHQEYNYTILNNDIALLKLKSKVQYNNYVQPACLWFDGINGRISNETSEDLIGTVVGWDEDESLNLSLSIATVPIVPDATCILYQPVFYYRLLNGLKFCAGPQNDTMQVNAKGGAYMMFMEDYKLPKSLFGPNTTKGPGAWYVKGILVATLKNYENDVITSDPDGYAVFTDIAKYRYWIITHI